MWVVREHIAALRQHRSLPPPTGGADRPISDTHTPKVSSPCRTVQPRSRRVGSMYQDSYCARRMREPHQGRATRSVCRSTVFNVSAKGPAADGTRCMLDSTIKAVVWSSNRGPLPEQILHRDFLLQLAAIQAHVVAITSLTPGTGDGSPRGAICMFRPFFGEVRRPAADAFRMSGHAAAQRHVVAVTPLAPDAGHKPVVRAKATGSPLFTEERGRHWSAGRRSGTRTAPKRYVVAIAALAIHARRNARRTRP